MKHVYDKWANLVLRALSFEPMLVCWVWHVVIERVRSLLVSYRHLLVYYGFPSVLPTNTTCTAANLVKSRISIVTLEMADYLRGSSGKYLHGSCS